MCPLILLEEKRKKNKQRKQNKNKNKTKQNKKTLKRCRNINQIKQNSPGCIAKLLLFASCAAANWLTNIMFNIIRNCLFFENNNFCLISMSHETSRDIYLILGSSFCSIDKLTFQGIPE